MDSKISIIGIRDYITSEDDTFDSIAYDVYGEEQMRDLLFEYNPDYLSYIFFPAGIPLLIPLVEKVESLRTKAPWAR